jgi:hypothetical protein
VTIRGISLAIFGFAVLLICAAEPEAVRFGPNGAFQLEHSKDDFGVRSHGVVERIGAGSRMYPLPQSDFATYARLRPKDVAINPLSATANHYEREETIGPNQVEGDKLWFGKSFYDGEGMRGVGAFGYFDAATRKYELFSPPAVACCEVSAILVEPEVVWLGLDQFGEDISTFPGGLVRWDRRTHAVWKYDVEFVVTGIAREGESLRLTTTEGYALLNGDRIDRFRVQTGRDGRKTSTPIARFPPPPSTHY